MNRVFVFSRHFVFDKRIGKDLARECICTGKRAEAEQGKWLSSKKYKKGELVVVWKQEAEVCFVITAYWKG